MPPAAGGFPQTPLTEEFETQEVREQEVREQLYICEVLHVGLKPQHAAPHKWCQDKSKDFTCQGDVIYRSDPHDKTTKNEKTHPKPTCFGPKLMWLS